MDTTMKTIELTLPDSELPFIKTIAKKINQEIAAILKLSEIGNVESLNDLKRTWKYVRRGD